MAQKSRGWCFTINNYTEEGLKQYLQALCRECLYYVIGREVGLKGTPHLQGYAYFKNARAMGGVSKLLGSKAHLEATNGTAAQNRDYCIKDGNFVEWGEMPKQGTRTDLKGLKDEILAGKKVSEILLEMPHMYHLYGRTLNAIEAVANESISRVTLGIKTKGYWIWGPTGVGKSYMARQMFKGCTFYVLPNDKNGWWEGYKGQDVVILDDFRAKDLEFNKLLQMVDEWEFYAPRRGAPAVPFISKYVIITTCEAPADTYTLESERNMEQLHRRFEIIHLTEKFQSNNLGTEVVG